MTDIPSMSVFGFVIRVYDETILEQAKRHKRKSSRRWQKKWRKRFGWVNRPVIRDGRIMRIGTDVLMMNSKTKQALLNQLEKENTKLWTQKIK